MIMELLTMAANAAHPYLLRSTILSTWDLLCRRPSVCHHPQLSRHRNCLQRHHLRQCLHFRWPLVVNIFPFAQQFQSFAHIRYFNAGWVGYFSNLALNTITRV